ncbi:MAG TPA: hypothetical protein VF168_12780 [Trueperaceae bacterium]
MARLIDRSFGIDDVSLAKQVRAGLELYVAVAERVEPALSSTGGELVRTTVGRLRDWLADRPGH